MELLKQNHKGVVLIEAAFIFPLFFFLMFGIFEVYRMKVADRLVESVATNVAIEFSSRGTVDRSDIEDTIRKCNQENSIRLISDADMNSKIRCIVDVFDDHEQAKKKSQETPTWPSRQGAINGASGGVKRGSTIVVTCCYKYEFTSALTRGIFMKGAREGNPTGSDNFLLIARRHFIKYG